MIKPLPPLPPAWLALTLAPDAPLPPPPEFAEAVPPSLDEPELTGGCVPKPIAEFPPTPPMATPIPAAL